MHLATLAAARKDITSAIKLATNAARSCTTIADLISIILCMHNFIHEVASCSQSQRSVRPAHGCGHTPAWLSHCRRPQLLNSYRL